MDCMMSGSTGDQEKLIPPRMTGGLRTPEQVWSELKTSFYHQLAVGDKYEDMGDMLILTAKEGGKMYATFKEGRVKIWYEPTGAKGLEEA